MNALAGTAELVRVGLRRDRVKFPAWVGGFTVFVVYVTAAIPAAYALDDLDSMSDLLAGPIGRLLVGPGYGFDDLSYPRVVANGYGLYFMLMTALMSILAVVRHTRAEEQSGRAELIRASAVGPMAPLAAAIIITILINVVAGLMGLAVLIALGGHPFAGSALLMAATVGVGLAWAGVTVLTVQITEHSRAAAGMAGGVLGAAFLLRAVGDMIHEGGSTMSWLSPLGWAQQTAPHVLSRWWPLALLAGFTLATTASGLALSRRRDFGAGLIDSAPGSPRAHPRLGTPIGLAARLQRGLILGWGLPLVISGAVFGAYAEGLRASFRDLPDVFVEVFGTDDLLAGYLAYTGNVFAYLIACYLIMVIQGLRTEETDGQGESVLATPLSRTAWLGSTVSVAAPAAIVILAATGLVTGVAAAAVTGNADLVTDLVAAHLNQVPAVMLVAGIAMLTFGWAPRLLPAVWFLPVYGMLAGTFGGLLDLPSVVLGVSPFEHVAAVPLEPFAIVPALALSAMALSLTPNGNVRYQLKTPYRDGTTHVIFEPLDFIARLAALVPKPRVHLTRFHGVFAPNSRFRARVTPARRGRGSQHTARTDREALPTPAERRAAMTWAQRLKRVFGIDIHTCAACGGAVRIIACIEDPEVIEKILAHLDKKTMESPGWPPPCRAPPQRGLFDSAG